MPLPGNAPQPDNAPQSSTAPPSDSEREPSVGSKTGPDMEPSAGSNVSLILASASPRRADLLQRIGAKISATLPANIDESPKPNELPREYALRMAREKALAAHALAAGTAPGTPSPPSPAPQCILAGDTVVAAGRRILPKALEEQQARDCLTLLSGRRHRVYSAVALMQMGDEAAQPKVKISQSIVRFKSLSEAEINTYIQSDEWRGKAGGYAIQGSAEGLIQWIQGSHSAVMGLPLFETRSLLLAAGVPLG